MGFPSFIYQKESNVAYNFVCILMYAGGKLLLELNRVLRPGGFFIWSATPVYQKLAEDVEIWKGE